jgi:hypothetical protein
MCGVCDYQRRIKTLAEYIFAIGRKQPSRDDARKISQIAGECGAHLIQRYEPQYMHWFETDNLGAPHDRDAWQDVITAIERADLGQALGWPLTSTHEA